MTEALPPGVKRTPFNFRAYKADGVKLRLEELFKGKCAYCESFYGSQAPVDVEHYRPKASVEGEEDHSGYWWLGMEWTNLLPSCLDCNRRRKQRTPQIVSNLKILYETMQTGKQDSFPIMGIRATVEEASLEGEEALLLDPTRDDPDEHLTFGLDDGNGVGLVYPKPSVLNEEEGMALPPLGMDAANVAGHAEAIGASVRGAVSIQVFGLNRMRLVQARAWLIQRLRFLETIVIELGDVIDRLDAFNTPAGHEDVTKAVARLGQLQRRILDEMRALAAPEAPYSAVAKAYLEDFKMRIASA
ncbi:endonuclease [Ochrobactrum sp. 30A/1000/2015]|nr:endonuclease [Ochrobactrum sp. 30A/1000/2015]PJT38625.1 endonuclease [Ochrobactrum sp. 27A/999/2015]PJT44641.1 endonuclease [Ochrobactrum sp. 23A/997/2015]